jgi:hypothetical protein
MIWWTVGRQADQASLADLGGRLVRAERGRARERDQFPECDAYLRVAAGERGARPKAGGVRAGAAARSGSCSTAAGGCAAQPVDRVRNGKQTRAPRSGDPVGLAGGAQAVRGLAARCARGMDWGRRVRVRRPSLTCATAGGGCGVAGGQCQGTPFEAIPKPTTPPPTSPPAVKRWLAAHPRFPDLGSTWSSAGSVN